MKTDRNFVRHRNDHGIPAGRKIEVIDPRYAKSDCVPEVSVIIPTFDGYRDGYFPALLKQLSEQTYQNFEIIIITGDQRQGRAINSGVDIARGKYLLTLDDDTRLLCRDSLEKLVRVMQADPGIGDIGSRQG